MQHLKRVPELMFKRADIGQAVEMMSLIERVRASEGASATEASLKPSGIIGGLVDGTGRNTAPERLAFLAGVFVLPVILTLVYNVETTTHLTSNWAVIISAGLLVGIGTRIANGCTSGHGVCGISRFSLRGIVATVLYILAGGLTLAIMRHVLEVI